MSEKKACPDCGSPDCRKAELRDYDDDEGQRVWADECWKCYYHKLRALEKVVEAKDAKIAVLYAVIEAMRHQQMMVANAAARREAGLED